MRIGRIAADIRFEELVRRLAEGTSEVTVSGLWGSSGALVSTEIQSRTGRPLLYVSSHMEEADAARDDLELFRGGECELLSAWETLPGEGAAAGEIDAERHRLCAHLAGHKNSEELRLFVAPVQALMQPVSTVEALQAHTMHLKVDETVDPEELASWLADHRFERLELVEAPGDFARRGDILDVFAPGENRPVRIEFFGDTVESIRSFDISTQRSETRLESFTICAAPHTKSTVEDGATTFFDYLPQDTLVVWDDLLAIQETGNTFKDRLDSPDSLYGFAEILSAAAGFTQIHLSRFGAAIEETGDSVHFDLRSLSRFEGNAGQAIGELLDLANDHDVVVVCENEGEAKRLGELLKENSGQVPPTIAIEIGYLHRGFEWTEARTVLVGHHEVFHRSRPTRRIRRTEAVRPLDTWLELLPGDVVVHAGHGIARFTSIKPMRKGDSDKTEEYLTLEFADKAVLHVPVSQIDLVQKYVGAGAIKPRLSKLGGTRWVKTKEKVGQAVEELAGELLRIQAARQANEGVAYPEDTLWQREYEESFPYDETEDQLIVADEIKADLRSSRPMDRLLCGDVGYGKTELAMRAAFKVAEFGKQVAVLVPTTVLAEQHGSTFTERLADYPFVVGCLSRFRSPKEQKKILEGVKTGQVDVVVGTHRLLSKDVNFADLGLVIIDEEQRFGVEHKERLKRFRETVEVLTMTATPIPRTLHMALLGIRDISSLATPPVDRRSIATEVVRFDEKLIRNAIIREINRDGQVYFVHNFVRSINAVADEIRRIVPECRIVVGHGQMKDGELEKVMKKFVSRQADVLVATTIIESGIDIPQANTIFIDRAERYGLADLHQLRGRVGRSKHRAYCYLLIPPDRPLTPKASKRLKAIEEFSELGAGFRIAMRDLEIRGAGNILGPEQSGHITAVGYEMYCQILERAVHRLRDEPAPDMYKVHLELNVGAYIPKNYVPSERSRIDIYRRTVACSTPEDLQQLQTDIGDAFGHPPKPVERLLDLAEIRVLACRWKIRSIIMEQPDIVFTVGDLALVQSLFVDVPGSVRMPDPRTVHLRLRPAYFETPTLLGFLRRLLSKEQKK